MRTNIYTSPTIEVAELFIEKGIAQSAGGGPGETPGVIYDPNDPGDNIDI
jgi:hypothetical protein